MKKNTKLLIYSLAFVALLFGVVILYNALSGSVTPQSTQPEGETTVMPEMIVYDFAGNGYTLSSFYSKPTIVNFWTSWCVYCKDEMPYFEKAYEKYGDQVNIMMLDVPDGGRETTEKGKAYIDDNGYTFPVYYDVDLYSYKVLGIDSYPTTLFIDRNGNIVDFTIGAISEEKLNTTIERLLG